MKRVTALILSFLLLAGALSGCGSDNKPYIPTGDALEDGPGITATTRPDTEEKSMAFPYYPDRSLNPYTCTDYTNRTFFSLLYQGLFTTDQHYNVSPVLCKNYYRSADMRTYTFTLERAAFSDGTTLTTADVIASLEAARAGAYYSGRFHHITAIEALDDVTFVIRMDTPFENLPILLDIPIVKADQVAEDTPIATGPYVVEDALKGKRLRKLPVWWCNANLPITTPYIPLVTAESSLQIRDIFEETTVGFVCANPCSDAYVDFRSDYELWDCANGIFLYLSCHEDSEIFSNPAIRSALSRAVDREYLVQTFYRGFAHSAYLPASPDSPYYDGDLAADYTYDITLLTQAVSEAELEDNEVVFLVNKEDTLRLRVARAIVQMLEQSGLDVTILETTYKYCEDYLRYGEYDLYLGQTRLSPNMDLSPFFSATGSLSYGGMNNVTLYALTLESLANSGNYYDLHRKVMDDGCLVPLLFHNYALYGGRGLVSELEPARDHIFYYDLGRTLADAKSEEPIEPEVVPTEPSEP